MRYDRTCNGKVSHVFLAVFLTLVHNMKVAPASRRKHREFKIIFDNLIVWTLANATLEELVTLADAAGLVQGMTPDATLVPASYCEPGFNVNILQSDRPCMLTHQYINTKFSFLLFQAGNKQSPQVDSVIPTTTTTCCESSIGRAISASNPLIRSTLQIPGSC